MKGSSILIVIIIIVFGIIGYFLIENENLKVREIYNESTGRFETYYPGTGNMLTPVSRESMEKKKNESNTQILLIGGGVLLIFGFVYFSTKSTENRKDPIKNLSKLKENKIISEEEFEDKIKKTYEVEKKNRIQKNQKIEADKLILELENLHNKGILSDKEFEDKLNRIKNNYD